MIEQHYYARTCKGLFTNGEVRDSIAKSPGLRPEFIQEHLHPLCEIEPLGCNRELPHFRIKPLNTGEVVVGQVWYDVGFIHHYVLSANEKRRHIKDPEKLFGITKFERYSKSVYSGELPTLAALPYEFATLFKSRDGFLESIRMSETMFKRILHAVFMALNSEAKVDRKSVV